MAGGAPGLDRGSKAGGEASAGPREAWRENAGDRTRLNRLLQRRDRSDWSPRSHVAVTSVLVGMLGVGIAHADGPPVPAAEPVPRSVADLDGVTVWLGPTGGAVHVDGAWDSAWGGGVQVLRIRERAALGVAGVWLGGVHYATRDGGRIWLEGVAGTRRLGGRMIGVAAGPALELGAARHPRVGGAVTAWWFAGITPYARAGALSQTGGFVELGVAISLPAWRN